MAVKQDQRLPRPLQVAAARQGQPQTSMEKPHLPPAKPEPHPEAVAAPLRRVARPLSAAGAEPRPAGAEA